MVLDDVPGFLEPELAQRGEHAALFGNRVRQNHVERAEPVRRDEQQRVAEVEHFADFAAFQFGHAGQIELCDCVHDALA